MCVCVCVRACVRACVCVFVCVTPLQVSKGTAIISCCVGAYEIWANSDLFQPLFTRILNNITLRFQASHQGARLGIMLSFRTK